ncbi:MAG: NAD(P)/FAD-dependent oxidoreductase, partial [Acidobacteria bacterium]|nr:NAD(P)/FAD-dependent oxidoreductase [Acidobacteriota bacterium]
MAGKSQVVILGGGFGGVYTAMYLEKMFRRSKDVEITIINSENYFVFQPMLPEVISGSIEIQHVINPIRRLCRHSNLVMRDVEQIDLEQKVIVTSPGFRPTLQRIKYDYLVIALGTVMNFSRMPGLKEHAFSFKNIGDALHLRNHIIRVLEEADMEQDAELRRSQLTFVVAGGGFSGVETAAELNDFVREAARDYRHLDPAEVRVILIHSGSRILPELSPDVANFAERLLRKRGVEIRLQTRLAGATAESAVLDTGEKIYTKTLVATVPAGSHPRIAELSCKKQNGRIVVNEHLELPEYENAWALGDCAWIPDVRTNSCCPPTAQYAVREARCIAANIRAAIRGGQKKQFRFSSLGMSAALGHRSAVAEILGIKVWGILAWFIWRTIYWTKLPGIERKLRVGVDWFLDVILPADIVQIKTARSQAVSQEHFGPDEMIFRQGDHGDRVYLL